MLRSELVMVVGVNNIPSAFVGVYLVFEGINFRFG